MVSLVFPARCAGCGTPGDGLCAACLARAAPAPSAPPPPGLDAWCSPYAYEGPVREAVARLKYRNERAVVTLLADAVAESVAGLVPAVGPPPPGVVVTWVPTSPARRRDRGFDHAELLARPVARRLRLPCRRLLRRLDTTVQTGRPASERRLGPRLAGQPAGRVAGVLLVDDVATTGSTMAAAARALRRNGVKWVIGATAARTLLKGGEGCSDTST